MDWLARLPGRPAGRTVRLAAAGMLSGLGGGLVASCFFLERRWNGLAPTQPDARLGLVHRHDDHGWIGYFSAFQTTSCFVLLWGGLLLIIASAGLIPKRNVVVRSSRLAWSMRYDPDGPWPVLLAANIAGLALALVAVATVGRALIAFMLDAGLPPPAF